MIATFEHKLGFSLFIHTKQRLEPYMQIVPQNIAQKNIHFSNIYFLRQTFYVQLSQLQQFSVKIRQVVTCKRQLMAEWHMQHRGHRFIHFSWQTRPLSNNSLLHSFLALLGHPSGHMTTNGRAATLATQVFVDKITSLVLPRQFSAQWFHQQSFHRLSTSFLLQTRKISFFDKKTKTKTRKAYHKLVDMYSSMIKTMGQRYLASYNI